MSPKRRMSSSSLSIRGNLGAFLHQTADRFEPFPFLRVQEKDLRVLAESISKPFTLAVFGRMKTGKSSLINALVGKPLAITGVEEATATLNWITYGDIAQQDSVLVHWKDGRTEPVPFSKVTDWSGKEPEVLKRVKETAFLQFFARAEYLKNVQIVDTPGTGSVADEHESVAREFLSARAAEDTQLEGRNADALLYVFPPVGRERDEESLSEFRRTRLPGSDPYNSIGVLHKWDGLESEDLMGEALKKAERLHERLSDVVCDVIPVSAPLAMVARHAPDSYLNDLLTFVNSSDTIDTVKKSLRTDRRWDDDENRRRIRNSYPLPWVSFVRIVMLLKTAQIDSLSAGRNCCLTASGMPQLEKELDSRFFKRSALIKQRLIRLKAKDTVQFGLLRLTNSLQNLATDFRHFQSLATRLPSSDPEAEWVANKAESLLREKTELEDYAVKADRDWIVEEEHMRLMECDLSFLEMMEKTPDSIEERDRNSIECLLKSFSLEDDRSFLPKEVLAAMLSRYNALTTSPIKKTRLHFEHLIARIQERLA